MVSCCKSWVICPGRVHLNMGTVGMPMAARIVPCFPIFNSFFFYFVILQWQLMAANSSSPTVALMFITRGNLPLESGWKAFLEGVRGMKLPPLGLHAMAEIMDDAKIQDMQLKMQSMSELTSSSLLRDASCVTNDLIKVGVNAALAFQIVTKLKVRKQHQITSVSCRINNEG